MTNTTLVTSPKRTTIMYVSTSTIVICVQLLKPVDGVNSPRNVYQPRTKKPVVLGGVSMVGCTTNSHVTTLSRVAL